MKKFILTVAICAATAFGSMAQSIFNSDDNKRRLGVEVSYDLQSPSSAKVSMQNVKMSYDMFDAGSGFSVGAFYQIPIFMNLYIEPRAELFYHTSKFDKGFLKGMSEDETLPFKGGSLRETGLNIPILAGYHFDFDFISLRVRTFTGPVFSLGFKGKFHYSTKVSDIDMSGSEGCYEDGGINRGNVSWRFGAGVDWKDKYRLSIFGDIGMTNALNNVIAEDGNHKVKSNMYRNTIGFALGYLF